MSWEQQTALVTGGTRGIGAAIAAELASRGVQVFITGRSKEYAPDPSIAGYLAVDFGDRTQTEAFLEEVRGIGGLSILINNAGINRIHELCDFPADDFDEIQEVNVRGPYRLMQAAAESMVASQTRGKILNIASIWATQTKNGRTAYCSSKAAILGMTRSGATDLASKGILVNALSPGFILTELTEQTLGPDGILEMSKVVPMGRLGQPEEIAKVAAFLVGPENTYLTGQNIIVDGGFTNV